MQIHCKFDQLKDPFSLKNHPRNRNMHGEDQIERLSELYKYHGIRHPIIVSTLSNCIVAGHGRKLAAIRAGIKEMPVVFQDFDSSEAEYAFLQADNAIAAWSELDLKGINTDLADLGPDFDINMLGIQGFTLDVAEKTFEGDPDDVPEDVEPQAKLGQIYKLGEHRLMCGNSTDPDSIKTLITSPVELCFTSPPYSDQREYRGDKELSTEYIATFISAPGDLVKYFAVNLGYSRKNGEVDQYWDDYIKEAKKSGLKLLSWNVWNKNECGSVGNQTAMFGISHEWIFVFGRNPKELNKTQQNKTAGEFKNHSSVRNRDGSTTKKKNRLINSHSQLKTVYDCAPQKARDEIDHPARFPVEFPIGYIEAMTSPGEFIYEPFGGSGSTLIACEKTNRKCFMMELDPHYVDVIIARWEKFTGKKAELLSE